MKRSEMIKHLEWWLSDQLIEDDYENAKDILSFIESLGMLPELNQEGKDLGWESSYNQVREYMVWEPESED